MGDLLTGDKVFQAMEYLAPVVHKTPLLTSSTTDRITGKHVYCKMENQQKTGAFKFRGATFKLMQLPKEQLKQGVITASAGNHAQGLAFAATKLGVHSTIFMPEKTPFTKVEATQNYGAEVVLTGASFQEAYEASITRQRETGAVYIHPFDDYDIMAGQGTIAIEMLQQEQRIDTILVPIGGGGLISGVAVAAKHINKDIQVIGVQARNAPAVYDAYHQSITPNDDLYPFTIAEGINVKEPGKLALPLIKKYVDDVITVSDEEIAMALLYMLERNKSLTEGAGATALAGLLIHNQQIKSEHCGVIISGGNIDVSALPMIQRLAHHRRFMP